MAPERGKDGGVAVSNQWCFLGLIFVTVSKFMRGKKASDRKITKERDVTEV